MNCKGIYYNGFNNVSAPHKDGLQIYKLFSDYNE